MHGSRKPLGAQHASGRKKTFFGAVLKNTMRPTMKPGDTVQVKTAAEILATLDPSGDTCGIPFMPEMLPFIGKRFRVAQLALKVCGPPGNIHMPEGTLYLEDLRCNGAAHGGCQAECRFLWRTDWLVRVDAAESPAARADEYDAIKHLTQRLDLHCSSADASRDKPTAWRCQATQLLSAGREVSWKQPGQYLREVAAGNVAPVHFARVMTRATLRYLGRKIGALDELPVKPAGDARIDGEVLGLHPGEWVEVRSAAEIATTLDHNGKHRGLSFTDEMAQHCGKRYRVRRRIDHIIDEGGGRMIEFKKYACIALDGLVCSGDCATSVWFCRRDLYSFWREAWLKRVD